MKVDNRIKIEATVQFQDLAVGDVYEDDEGVVCIKTGDDYGDSPYGKCIAFVSDEWREEDIRLHRSQELLCLGRVRGARA